MKIAWVTPLAQTSAIGRVSAAVLRALAARDHEVLVIRSEHDRADASPTHPVSVPTIWWHDATPADIEAQNDVIVLNFGDNYNFHAGALAFVDKVSCLGIFHDFYLYNLFNRWLVHAGLDEQAHDREVCLTYNENLRELAKMAWGGTAPIERVAEMMPMTEWIARRCGAALAHAHFYIPRLESSCPGPIAVAPLCYEARPVNPLPTGKKGRIAITCVGIVNPNKCVDSLITAIASSALLRKRCQLRLVGAIAPSERDRLNSLCRRTGYKDVIVLGEVDDVTLVSELDGADILSCLRNPVLEGASASAIEGMLAGRPIVVANAGFYSELPDDLVFKVPSAIDVASLRATLEALVNNEHLRRDTGAKARIWASQNFTTDTYVPILENLILQFIGAKPLLSVGKRIGHQLAMLGISLNDPSVGQLATKMTDLFGGDRS